MSEAVPVRPRFALLCVADEEEVLDALLRDLKDTWGEVLEVEGLVHPAEALDRFRTLHNQGVMIPLVIADHGLSSPGAMALMTPLHDEEAFRPTRRLLVSASVPTEEASPALKQGILHGHLAKPWDRDEFRELTRCLVTEFFVERAPRSVDLLGELADIRCLSRALADSEHHRHAMGRELQLLQRSFLTDRLLSDEEVDRAMIEEFDKVLGTPERTTLPAGTLLLREGQTVEHITILIDGQARLSRDIQGHEIVFHSASIGRIVGLLALAQGSASTFTCKAVTDITVIQVTLTQLEDALQRSPNLSLHFVTVLLRSMVRRNRRSIELHVEIKELLGKLERERDQLARTLHELKATQLRLVESEKMATLGQMAAGIGHELNNPVAAIRRSADFLLEDLEGLAENHPDKATFLVMLRSALEEQPVSTRRRRALQQQVLPLVEDRQFARRLVKIGLHEPKAWERHGLAPGTEEAEARLTELERYYQAGASLRNIRSCAGRIVSLVESIRSYARSDVQLETDIDLHRGLEDTLQLFAHELRPVEVERDFGDLPLVHARPGELNQVWTNLISNAIQVMPENGHLTVRTAYPDPLHVRVDIIDNGPGIPGEHLDRIFEVNFTTRQGLTGFGLGIGLAICRDIIHRHSGRIEVDTRPGHTRFSVFLPVRQEHDTHRSLPHNTE